MPALAVEKLGEEAHSSLIWEDPAKSSNSARRRGQGEAWGRRAAVISAVWSG